VFESYHGDKNKREGYQKVEQGKKAHFKMPVYRIEPSDCNLKPSQIAFRAGGVEVDWFKKDDAGNYWITAPKVGTHMINVAVYAGAGSQNFAEKSFNLKLEVYASKTPVDAACKHHKLELIMGTKPTREHKFKMEMNKKMALPMPVFKHHPETCKKPMGAKIEYITHKDKPWIHKDGDMKFTVDTHGAAVGHRSFKMHVWSGEAKADFTYSVEIVAAGKDTDKKACKVFELYSPQYKGTVKTYAEIDAKIKTPMDITLPTYKQKEDCKAKV